MKKETKMKNHILNWFITFAFSGLIGLFCFAQNEIKQVNAEEDYYEISQPYKVNYNDNDSEIEITASELNNYTWNNLYNYINNNYESYTEMYLMYNETEFYADIGENRLQWYSSSDNSVRIILDNSSKKFTYVSSFEYSISFVDGSYYQALKSAIQLDVQANQTPSSGGIGSALTDFISLLVGGISDLASGIANGVSGMAKQLFLEVDVSTGAVTGLSTFGGIVAIFAGIALAVGITTRVYTWVTSLGN